MTSVVTLVCAALLQQLQGAPFPAEVGQPMTVRATRAGEPQPGVQIVVELPDGSRRDLGPTGADGSLAFVPETPGGHVFAAELAGVKLIAPHPVVAPRRRWLLALASVPLGSVLLWRLSRARGRRDP